MDKLSRGEDWRGIAGIAYRRGEEIVANPLRPAIEDLDLLPFPERSDIDYRRRDLSTASVLGSRGCPWNCNFCSIRPFYEAQGGKLRRLRSPAAVVEEMRQLHVEQGARIFLFQDDDFLATGRRAREWAEGIADGVIAAGLAGRIAFKISCRSDEVRHETMARLVEAGLTHVYMGVENGDEQGLVNLNKMLKPHQHIEAGKILRELDVSFDFGFMLLEPYSTIATVRSNIAFLERFVGDGWTVAGFCRTLPYAGTPLKRQLEAEGRLLGNAFEPDYNFLDPKLDLFYDWMLLTFRVRNFDNAGLVEVLRSLVFEAHLKLPDFRYFRPSDRARLHSITAQCNGHALYCLGAALDYIEATPIDNIDIRHGYLGRLTAHELAQERQLTAEVSAFYWSARARQGLATPQSPGLGLLGGFENSWTLAPARSPHHAVRPARSLFQQRIASDPAAGNDFLPVPRVAFATHRAGGMIRLGRSVSGPVRYPLSSPDAIAGRRIRPPTPAAARITQLAGKHAPDAHQSIQLRVGCCPGRRPSVVHSRRLVPSRSKE